VVGAPLLGAVSVFFSPAPPPPTPPPPPPPTEKPVLSKLAVNPRTIHLASSRPKPPRTGAITFTLSTAATVRLSFANTLRGRTAASRCTKPTRANRRQLNCRRVITVRSFTFDGKGGTNTIALAGNLFGRTPLPIGRYRLRATPTSASGVNGTARKTTFRIVK
jgi:hypothetical protein